MRLFQKNEILFFFAVLDLSIWGPVVGGADAVLLGIAEDGIVLLLTVGFPPAVVPCTCIIPFIVIGWYRQ